METWSIVTGANRGLGKAITNVLLEEGSSVLGVCRTPCPPPVGQGKGKYMSYCLDLQEQRQIVEFGRWLEGQGMMVRCLVNNAGVCLDGGGSFDVENAGFLGLASGDLEHTFQINLFAPLYLVQAVCQRMPPGGLILNISSALGDTANLDAGWLAYRMSKAALNVMTRVLARELAPRRLMVNAVEPGWVRTAMGGPEAPVEPRAAAVRILGVIQDLLTGRISSGTVLSCDP